MKKLLLMCAVVEATFCLCAETKPNASVHLLVTSRLPIRPQEGCSGILSVTNTGMVAFSIVTAKGWSGETMLFYRGGTEEQERLQDENWGGKQWKKQAREQVKNDYYFGIEKYSETVKTLQPGEGISFESNDFYFTFSRTSSYTELYKAEMYLGHDTWVPVTISPPIGYIKHIDFSESGKDNVFVFAQEGTNQFLYLKMGEEFKRVGEIKLDSKPKKEEREDAVTFELPDGTTKKLTRDQARQIVREREQQNQ